MKFDEGKHTYYFDKSLSLLQKLIEIPSFSGEEDQTADLLFQYLQESGFRPQRKKNNIWAEHKVHGPKVPTLLLNSHHDTVRPGKHWDTDPFRAVFEGNKLTGLGSNDAGASLVSLLHLFLWLSEGDQPYNLVFLASAEEETSGKNGVPIVIEDIGKIDLAVVGEPTSMELAIAERGLMVLDCESEGESGHAARGEGINAIYRAISDIEWFRNFDFEKKSEVLGAIHMNVTMIEAGSQHNVVPDSCSFVVDVRTNEQYTNKEVLEIIRNHVDCTVTPRSTHLNASGISLSHPVVKKAESLNIPCYGSQTMSDQVHMSFPSVKIGPGDTRRSHTANEYVYTAEISDGLKVYFELLNQLEIENHG